jgi:hypothetical protein
MFHVKHGWGLGVGGWGLGLAIAGAEIWGALAVRGFGVKARVPTSSNFLFSESPTPTPNIPTPSPNPQFPPTPCSGASAMVRLESRSSKSEIAGK